LLIAIFLSNTYNASAVSYSLPKTRTPTATVTQTATPTPAYNPYPPAETPDITTPDTSQSYKLFLPIVGEDLIYTTSYYMSELDSNKLFTLGCELGQRDNSFTGTQNSVVILDFGYPYYDGSEYGTIMFDYNFASTTDIGIAVGNFAKGYYYCLANELSYLTIAVGTNNCGESEPGNCAGSQVTKQHGEAWAKMVNGINDILEREGYFPIIALGASDIEIAWNSPIITRDWVEGYNAFNSYLFYNYGDAQGCPIGRTYGVNRYCDNGWYMEDVWYVSYGAGASKPLPLIYATGGENAYQWYSLSAYAYDKYGFKMDIKGSVTQYQACIQTDITWCQEHYVDNTPAQGYNQLLTALNVEPFTAQNLKWATDMKWQR
jgi:hypothetical protein